MTSVLARAGKTTRDVSLGWSDVAVISRAVLYSPMHASRILTSTREERESKEGHLARLVWLSIYLLVDERRARGTTVSFTYMFALRLFVHRVGV